MNNAELQIWLFYGQAMTKHPTEHALAKKYFDQLKKDKADKERGFF